MDIKFAVTRPEVKAPTKSTPGSAGFDMFLPEDITVYPGEKLLVQTGIVHECTSQLVGVLSPRSGLALKKGLRLFFAPALIDSDYRGEIGVYVENMGTEPIHLLKGDRFAQIVYLYVYKGDAEEVALGKLSSTDRGIGGWGSTGGHKQ